MADPKVRQGTIVRAWFTPTRGERKYRWAAIYAPDEVLGSATHVDIVMISTSCFPDDPLCIPLPYHPTGNVSTRLRKRSSLALAQTNTVPIQDIEPTTGYIPNVEKAQMLAELKRMGKL